MNRCKSALWRLTSSKSFGVIGLALVLCVIATAGSGTGGKDSPTSQFTLRAIPVSAVHHAWQAPRIGNKNGTSTNWSGYAVLPIAKTSSGKGKKSTSIPTFSAVEGSWEVPTVEASTSTNTYSSTWVGLDGYDTGTVEQIGIEQDWSGGGAEYYAWFEMYPKWAYEIVGFPVKPGDTISAQVEYGAKGAFTLTIANLDVKDKKTSLPVTFSITQRSPSAQRLSAEWIEEAPWSSGVLSLADFGTVDFFDCYATMNGNTGAIDDDMWQYDAITMETSDGTVKAEPSVLSSDGAGFSVTWGHE
jgi:hypothetical protein